MMMHKIVGRQTMMGRRLLPLLFITTSIVRQVLNRSYAACIVKIIILTTTPAGASPHTNTDANKRIAKMKRIGGYAM